MSSNFQSNAFINSFLGEKKNSSGESRLPVLPPASSLTLPGHVLSSLGQKYHLALLHQQGLTANALASSSQGPRLVPNPSIEGTRFIVDSSRSQREESSQLEGTRVTVESPKAQYAEVKKTEIRASAEDSSIADSARISPSKSGKDEEELVLTNSVPGVPSFDDNCQSLKGSSDAASKAKQSVSFVGEKCKISNSESVLKKHPDLAGKSGEVLMYYNTWFTIRIKDEVNMTSQVVKLRRKDVILLETAKNKPLPRPPIRKRKRTLSPPRAVPKNHPEYNSENLAKKMKLTQEQFHFIDRPVSVVSGCLKGHNGVIRTMRNGIVTVLIDDGRHLALNPQDLLLLQPRSEGERKLWEASSILLDICNRMIRSTNSMRQSKLASSNADIEEQYSEDNEEGDDDIEDEDENVLHEDIEENSSVESEQDIVETSGSGLLNSSKSTSSLITC